MRPGLHNVQQAPLLMADVYVLGRAFDGLLCGHTLRNFCCLSKDRRTSSGVPSLSRFLASAGVGLSFTSHSVTESEETTSL